MAHCELTLKKRKLMFALSIQIELTLVKLYSKRIAVIVIFAVCYDIFYLKFGDSRQRFST